MIVSRPSVSTTEITDFGKSAFIRLPIEKYLSLLGVKPIAPQIALVNAINDPAYRFVVGALSRRTGKTFISNIIGQLILLVPGSSVLIMSPNYSLSGISWNEQKKLLKKFDVEVTKSNEKDKVIELMNGSTLRIGSISQADSVVGRSYDFILFDECALDSAGREAFNVQLRPTLDKENSKAIFISTPRGANYFKDFYDRGFSSSFPSWCSILSTWRDNPRAIASDIEEAALGMSSAEFKQEYFCDFVVMQGVVYDFSLDMIFGSSSWLADIGELIPLDDYTVVAGLDVGYRDPLAFGVYLICRGNVYVVGEYLKNEKDTSIYAAEINSRISEYDIDFIFIDSAHQQMREDFASIYEISTVNAKKNKLPGLSFASMLVENNRVFVHHSCKEHIAMFKNYAWDNRPGKIKEDTLHDQYSHMADAFRYGVYSYSENIEIDALDDLVD
jgi:hypothetical protein